MKLILVISVIAVCLPTLVLSQLFCHRCYGNSYCNNASHVDFASNIKNVTCNLVNSLDFETEDPHLQQIQKALNQNFLKELSDSEASPFNTTIEGHCVTATVHEPHDTHTLRTCVQRVVPANNNVTLCELLQNTIAPQNRYNGTFTCRQCNRGHFCNDHTLRINDGIADSATAVMLSGPLAIAIAMVTLYKLF